MSAAEIAIWTRRRATTQAEIDQALWTSRVLVRTSAMRLTLHVVPSSDLAVYVAALQSMAAAFLQGYLSRAGATPQHVQTMIRSVAESVEDGPKTRQELLAAARKKVGRAMRGWLDQSWSGVRPAVIDGAIVYGPPRGAEATYVATDAWLGPQPRWDVEAARVELLRRFLSACGPATPHDFAKWSGHKTSDARQRSAKAGAELAAVSVDGAHGWILRRDAAALSRCELDRAAVTLLGAFDSFLLAHATKEHLVDARFYKRVYRPQGWISPVILRGGTVAGVWFPERVKGAGPALDVTAVFRAIDARRCGEGLARARPRRRWAAFLGTPRAGVRVREAARRPI